MFELDDHIKIFGILFNIIIGTGLVVYCINLYNSYARKILKSIIIYILLYNLMMTALFVSKYVSLNQNLQLSNQSNPILSDLFIFLVTLIGLSLNFILVTILIQFRTNLNRSRTYQWAKSIFLMFILVLIISISFPKLLFPGQSQVRNVLFILCIFVIEFFILIWHLNKKHRSSPENKVKISKVFTLLILSRYLLFLIMFALLLY